MSSKIFDIPCNATVRNGLSSMVYNRWCKACDNLKTTETLTRESANKFCPKNEWPLYHESMLNSAKLELQTATMLKEIICQYSPLIMVE